MRSVWSIVWKVALALAVPGVVIGAIGLSMGGPDSGSWAWPGQPQASVADVPAIPGYTPPGGGQGAGAQAGSPATAGSGGPQQIHIDEPALDPFSSLYIEAVTMDVSVIASDHFSLKVDSSDTKSEVAWSYDGRDDGVILHLQETVPNHLTNPGTITATITVPEGTALDIVDQTSTTGDIRLAVPASLATVRTDTGDVRVEGAVGALDVSSGTGAVTVSGETGEARVQASTGDVTVSGASTSLTVQAATGDVTVTGAARTADLQAATGNVVVKQATPWSATTYNLTTATGSIRLAGTGAPQVASSFAGNVEGPAVDAEALSLTASTSIGTIDITLGA